MSRATIDTNVFVSALNFGGVPAQIFDFHTDEEFTLCISMAIVDEIKRILIDRFKWTEKAIDNILEPILSRAEMVTPKTPVSMSPDPDDNHILECALESKSDFIVTGDDHLLQLGALGAIQIVKPRVFLNALQKNV
jgi:putative PIN family toxin of toxin-antitoxin system